MRFCIVGTGRIAKRFVPECMAVKDAVVTAVYNPHEGSAERFIDAVWSGREWERPGIFTEMSDMWDLIDAVYIASPHETHFNYIMRALEHGKHVLCEKPTVLSADQAEKAFRFADEKGLILMEGIKTAYCPGYQKVLSIARSGSIGDIRYIEACFTKLERSGSRELTDTSYGGSFTELGSYVMLPVMDLLGYDHISLSFDSITDKQNIDSFTKADIRYPDAMATLICGLGVKAEGRLIISGTKGYIKVDAPWWKTRHIEVHFEDESKTVVYDEVFEGDGLRYEISSFMEGTGADANRSKAMAGMMERFLGLRTTG